MKKTMIAALVMAASVPLAAPALAACQRWPATYDLPAQRLDESAQQMAHISGCPIRVDMRLVADRRAPALVGRYRPEEALARLIRGTGYTAYSTEEGLAFDNSVLTITMSQVRVLRTALRDRVKARSLAPQRAARLRALLNQVERTLPRQVNTQGMLTAAQKREAIDRLDAVRAAVGPVQDAHDWAAFKHGAA